MTLIEELERLMGKLKSGVKTWGVSYKQESGQEGTEDQNVMRTDPKELREIRAATDYIENELLRNRNEMDASVQ